MRTRSWTHLLFLFFTFSFSRSLHASQFRLQQYRRQFRPPLGPPHCSLWSSLTLSPLQNLSYTHSLYVKMKKRRKLQYSDMCSQFGIMTYWAWLPSALPYLFIFHSTLICNRKKNEEKQYTQWVMLYSLYTHHLSKFVIFLIVTFLPNSTIYIYIYIYIYISFVTISHYVNL